MINKYIKLIASLLSISILAYLFFRFDPVTNFLFPTCPFYASTGMYCPGCGSQRATHALLHFDFVEVFNRNLLFIPGIVLLFYHYTIKLINHFLNKNYVSFLNYKRTPIILLIIVILFGILRNINMPPFSYLAP